MTKRKSMLWISRHTMNEQQREDIKRLFGDVEVRQFSETVNDIAEIHEEIKKADIIAAVFPLLMMRDLSDYVNSLGEEKTILIPKAIRILHEADTEGDEKRVEFRHGGWIRINSISIDADLIGGEIKNSEKTEI